MHIDDITPAKGQRVIILGSSRSGKSVAADHIHMNIVKMRPQSEHLLLDTKPRFRAELEKIGPGGRIVRDASRYYKDWEKGPIMPGSYRHDINNPDLSMYWKPKDPCRTVILQTEKDEERNKLLEIADTGWFEVRKKGADRVLRVNELLDFYYGNGVCISSRHNVPLKVNRAGGERGFSGIYESQRARGFPLQLVEEATLILLFHLKYEDDMKFLWQNGVPRDIYPPKDVNYAFRMITTNPGGMAEDHGLYKLTPKPWYLEQLSDT
jgi:hypothetical protein